MRLLYVSHSFPPRNAPLSNVGGMQRVATELHAALEARDDVVMRTLALHSSWKWVHVRAVPFLTSLAARLRYQALRFRPDAILFTSMTTALPLLLSARRLKARGIRLASIAHGLDVTDPNRAYQLAVRGLCDRLDVALPVSRATREELIDRGMPSSSVHVVPNAVDLSRFEGIAAGHTRHSLTVGGERLPENAFLLVAVGRQVLRKGFAWFVEEVMPKLPEHVVFWLAGEGPERPAIDAAISAGRLGRRVRCLGKIDEDDLLALYGRGDLFVMPNINVPGDMEGFGIVMLEAGACGLPTLAADLEGIRDVVEEGVNGWLCPTGDADAFADRIRSLAEAPADLAEARQRTAAYVSSTFRWSNTAEQYLEVLRGV